jgi:hypothetical protein
MLLQNHFLDCGSDGLGIKRNQQVGPGPLQREHACLWECVCVRVRVRVRVCVCVCVLGSLRFGVLGLFWALVPTGCATLDSSLPLRVA